MYSLLKSSQQDHQLSGLIGGQKMHSYSLLSGMVELTINDLSIMQRVRVFNMDDLQGHLGSTSSSRSSIKMPLEKVIDVIAILLFYSHT